MRKRSCGSAGSSTETPPYIRRTRDNRLLVTVAVPVERDKHTVGIISLTREARAVDESLFTVRMSILALIGLALALTVLLSWYLSLTIARPILRLAALSGRCRPPLSCRYLSSLLPSLHETLRCANGRLERIAFCVDQCASVQQSFDRIRLVECSSKNQRRLAPFGFDRIDVSAGLYEVVQ